MSTQTNALRLAARLDEQVNFGSYDWQRVEPMMLKAAKELRAQHELIQKLTASLEECVEDSEAAIVDYLQKYGQTYKAQRVAAMRKQVADARAALAAVEAHK